MSKLIAIDWDSQELRTAVGRAGRKGLTQVVCRATSWDEAEQQGLAAGSFAAAAWALERLDAARGRGILFARRQHLETSTLNAPPTSDEDLPDLVANHLLTDLGAGSESAAYDFYPLDASSDVPRRIAIAAMDEENVAEYRHLAAALKLVRPRLTVRAGGLLNLLREQGIDVQEPSLVLAPNVEEIDLAVLAAGRLAYWRSIYCSPPAESDSFRGFLSAEVQRTLAVAEENLPEDSRIVRLLVAAGGSESTAAIDAINRLDVAETLAARLEPELPDVEVVYEGLPGPAGRFAPLLGALAQEARRERPAIDLLNPPVRKRSAPSRRPWALAAAGAALALVLGLFVLREEVADRQREATALARQLADLEKQSKKVQPAAKTWQAIEAWNAANLVWLDELRDLAIRFPPAGTAVVLDFSASPSANGGAVIRMSGKALDPTVVAALDRDLRDEHRDILSRNLREQASAPDDPFLWRFESVLNVRRQAAAAYLESASPVNQPLSEDGP